MYIKLITNKTCCIKEVNKIKLKKKSGKEHASLSVTLQELPKGNWDSTSIPTATCQVSSREGETKSFWSPSPSFLRSVPLKAAALTLPFLLWLLISFIKNNVWMMAGITCCYSVQERISFLKLTGLDKRKEILSEARDLIYQLSCEVLEGHISFIKLCMVVIRNLQKSSTRKFKFDETGMPCGSHQKYKFFLFQCLG